MKTTITHKLLGLALSVFSLTAAAQCPSITNLSVAYGAPGTATITPTINGSVSSSLTTYYWQTSPNVTQTSQSYQPQGIFQFPGNGTYSVCLSFVDSLGGCSSNQFCTTATITNMSPSSCVAAFTAYTDSSCVTHFMNGTTGGNTFNWHINGSTFTSYNPTLNLPNGSYPATLIVYSGGTFCDSVTHLVTVGCGGGGTTTACQASFSYYTDSTTCLTHFTNTTPCTYSTSSWVINGTTYYTSNPVLNLPNFSGSHVQLNVDITGTGVSSTGTQTIYINCAGSGTTTSSSCHANAQFVIFADSTNSGNYFAYNLSAGSGNVSYLWDFGDGTLSTQQYPFHQYAVPGQYIICLTVTGTYTTAFGGTTTCSDTYCDSSSVHKSAAFIMSQMNVIPQSVTGIKQTEQLTNVNAYPNPIADQLIIEAYATDNNKLTYVLIDALGRTVLNGNVENSKAILNTSSLEKGFYSLSLSNEKGNALKTVKLVK